MWRYAVFALLAAALANAQAAGQSSPGFAGCYEVTSLTWSPPGDVKSIPKNLELLNVARGDGSFHMRAVGVETNGMDRFWWWEPNGPNKIAAGWGSGLGGFRGTLKRAKNGDLEGKLKEWCDARCGWKKETGRIQLHKVACTPN